MIFLDANYFLRFLVQLETLENQVKHEMAARLFDSLEGGDAVATTSEAVLAEVAFVLASKRQYNLPAADIAAYLSPIIRLPGLRLPRGRKKLYLRALEIWTEHPKLGFVDALTAATVEHSEILLASFDSDFDVFPDIGLRRPPEER